MTFKEARFKVVYSTNPMYPPKFFVEGINTTLGCEGAAI
jgi:hypothetical protein